MDCDQRQTGEEELTGDPLGSAARLASEHVPEKWVHFSMVLQAARKQRGTSYIDLRPPAQSTKSLRAVKSKLETEHRGGFWHRGQRMQRECLYKGSIPRMEGSTPDINPIHVVLDALVPSAFRNITYAKPAAWEQFHVAPPLDYLAGPARAIFASRDPTLGKLLLTAVDHMLFDAFRVGQAEKINLGLAESLLAPGSTAAQATLDLISIAQHYEYGSIIVDVSTSIDAAVWFATRDWVTGNLAGSEDGSPGVIYRIGADRIFDILRKHVNGPDAMPPAALQAFGMFGLADISERFDFLDRPKAQSGGSLLGMENFVTHFLMQINGVIDVFPFDHSSVSGSEIALARDDICPPYDKGAEIFRPSAKYSAAPVTDDELLRFLEWMNVESAKIRHLIEMRQFGII
jgi:hypothetical protein